MPLAGRTGATLAAAVLAAPIVAAPSTDDTDARIN